MTHTNLVRDGAVVHGELLPEGDVAVRADGDGQLPLPAHHLQGITKCVGDVVSVRVTTEFFFKK